MSDTRASLGTLETRQDAGKGQEGVVTLWLDALAVADREEKTWRERGDAIEQIYRDDSKRDVSVDSAAKRKFNILYSNTETLGPALYNTPPIPDVRRRFRDTDPVGKVAATLLERGLSYSIDCGDFDARMNAAVKDTLLPGRGVLRMRYEPIIGEDGTILSETVGVEEVAWRRFRRGPGLFWHDVPWVAFEHFMTREEFVKLAPGIGARIDLDCSVTDNRDMGDGKPVPDIMKRGRCWEIWDREKREVVFIAPAYTDGPVRVLDDPLGLRDFFPVPRPLYGVETPGNLVPVPLYRTYQGLAEDLEITSRRIASLVSAMKWRGAYADPAIGDFLAKFEDVEDGGIIPIDNPSAAIGGGLDKAFWFQPIEVLVGVLTGLYESREQTKQAIYEVTGISDIVRGASHASETATAQQIKAQWGSLRIQKLQREVQRFSRDLLRMMAEIIAEKFQPETIFAMAGMQLPTQAQLQMAQEAGQPVEGPSAEEVIQFLRNDTLRNYRVDIETDSTIRADLSMEQQNISMFVQGFGQFIQAIGPAVQAQFVPQKDAATLLKSFARSFKLGRDAEDAIESLGEQQPPQQADPAQAEQAKAQVEAQKAQMEAQVRAQESQMKAQADQAKAQADQQLALAKLQADAQSQREKLEADFAMARLKEEAETRREAMRLSAAQEQHLRQLDADDMRVAFKAERDTEKANADRAAKSAGGA